MSDPSVTYRDATYSAETQAKLKELLSWVGVTVGGQGYVGPLLDVIDRWDANEATEMVFDRDGAPA